LLHRRFDAHHEGLGPGWQVGPGQHRANPRRLQRGGEVNQTEFGVRVWRAKYGGVEGAGFYAEVVGIATAARKDGAAGAVAA
jgi:hypothetical protein